MDILASLLVTVVGGVACHYIIKWLDSNGNDNWPKTKPSECSPGVFICAIWTLAFALPNGIIAYANLVCNMLFT